MDSCPLHHRLARMLLNREVWSALQTAKSKAPARGALAAVVWAKDLQPCKSQKNMHQTRLSETAINTNSCPLTA